MSNQHRCLLEFAEFRLDCEQGVLYRLGTIVSLPPKAIQTLIFLAERPGEVVTKDELMKAIWPDTFVEEGNLTFNIHLIRKALNAREDQPFIETLSKRGYRFVAEVRPAQDVTPVEAAPRSPEPAPMPQAASQSPRTLVLLAALAAIVVFALIASRRSRAVGDSAAAATNVPLPALIQLTIHAGSNSQPDVSPDGRRVVFVSNRDGGHGQIYVMDSDGGHPRNLTGDPRIHDDSPAWSPDGRRIAFQSNRRGATELSIMDADGGHATPVTPGARAAWSPDGTMLAYVRSIDGHNEIFVIRADQPGAQPRQLTHDHHFCADPTWSPDGSRIAFTSEGAQHLEVHSMRADGTGRVVLSASRGDDRLPVWWRDGRIAFNSTRDGHDALYVMESDGALQHRVSDGKFDDAEAAWWPDGRSLIFESDRSGNPEIYRMRLPDTPDGAIRLTSGLATNQSPAWSPDGRWIAFESTREGKPNIFVMDSDGRQAKNLTHSPAGNYEPRWSWDGTRIAFSSDRDGKRAIYTMNADGSGVRKVSEGEDDRNPAWSADGQICFDRGGEIWIAGTPSRHLASGTQCTWRPDNRQIVFARNAPGAIEIYAMNPRGGDLVALTGNGHGNGVPAWSRDGAWIAFNSNSDGYGFGIFVMKSNGAQPVRVTARREFDNQPSWSPDGLWIVFARDRDHTWDLYKIAVPEISR